jgi:hypothetical protein
MSGQTTDTQWYIAREGKQHGPLSDIEMRTFVAHNYLRATDLIWRPGMTEWTLAPSVFPAVFPEPNATTAASEPQSELPHEPVAMAEPQLSSNTSSYDPYQEPSQPDAFETRSRVRDRNAAPDVPRKGIVRRVMVAATSIGALGAIAYGALAYREPLMQMIAGGGGDAAASVEAKVAEPPVVQADISASTSAPTTTAAVTPPAPTPPVPEPSTTTAATSVTPTSIEPSTAAVSPTTSTDTSSSTPVTATPAAPAPDTATAASPASPPTPDAGTRVAALEPTAPVTPPASPVTGPSVDERLQKIASWSLLKKNYPDWYRDQVAAADKLVSEQKPPVDVSMQLAQALVSLRRQNADKALAASPDKLRKIASAFLDNLKSLRTQSVSACYGFISKGEASPAVAQIVDSSEADTAFHAQVAAIFEAVSEGSSTPTKHEAAVKADYDLLIKELGKLGWKEEDLQTFSNPRLLAKREPERVCKMVQDWFVAHLAVADKGARDRLLYETLKPVVSG